MRRAINYAIDRRRLATAGGTSLRVDLSCQLLPENMIGYSPHCPYTKNPTDAGVWTGRDLDTARRLVAESKTAGQRVTVWVMEGDSIPAVARRRTAPVIVEALNAIGYQASIDEVPGNQPGYFQELGNLKSKRQIMLTGWITDYPGPANYFLPLMTCPQTLAGLGQEPVSLTSFCSPDIDKLTIQALDLQETDPAASARLWAQVDRAVTDAAPLVPWGNLRNVFFVSPKVGNVQGHIAYLVLLSQMWVVEEGSPSPTPG